jgi:ATP-dependent Clp endopeptidase proteolytic subunit ClpP
MADEKIVSEPHASQVAKFEAEAARALADARKANAEAEAAECEAAAARLVLEDTIRKNDRLRYADDYEDRTYRFLSSVSDDSVSRCIRQLDAWHREDSACKMTIIFDSPGGSVVPGFHLFDHILQLRASHRIDTVTRGYAASMGGILLQAGEKRSMGPNAALMIHEVSFGAQGKIGDIEDATDFAKILWNRALDIFADRCKNANDKTATKRLTRRMLLSRSDRINWWIKASDALAFGLVDEVQ